jgi:hypothetical protein
VYDIQNTTGTHAVCSRIGFGDKQLFLCHNQNGDIIPNPDLIQQDWQNVLDTAIEPFDKDQLPDTNSLASAIKESHRNGKWQRPPQKSSYHPST